MLFFFVFVSLCVSLSFSKGSSFQFPDYEGPPLDVQSGYVADMFHVHFVVPQADSVLIWFQGGPGCSGLVGMMLENGPVHSPDGVRLKFRQSNWPYQLNVSSVYFEQPFGTGFSNGRPPTVLSDLAAAQKNADFIEQFLTAHSQYRRVFIAGESHGGLYVPLTLQELEKRSSPSLKLVTHVALGNPRFSCSDKPESPWQSNYVKSISFDILRFRGLVPHSTSAAWDVGQCQTRATSSKCSALLESLLSTLPLNSGYLSTDNFLLVKCLGRATLQLPTNCSLVTPMNAMTMYLNRLSVQRALNVLKPTNWTMCNPIIANSWKFDGGSMIPILERISIDHNIRLLVYNGDLDILEIPPAMTRYCLGTSARWNRFGEQEAWFVQPGLWAGMRERINPGNVTWASLHGAGHLAPMDQPRLALELIRTWFL